MITRIVVCADGTWNRPEKDLEKDVPTNVLRLARAIKPVASDGAPQQVFYDWGIGSYHDRVSAGATGKKGCTKTSWTTPATSFRTTRQATRSSSSASAAARTRSGVCAG